MGRSTAGSGIGLGVGVGTDVGVGVAVGIGVAVGVGVGVGRAALPPLQAAASMSAGPARYAIANGNRRSVIPCMLS